MSGVLAFAAGFWLGGLWWLSDSYVRAWRDPGTADIPASIKAIAVARSALLWPVSQAKMTLFEIRK